MFRSVRSATRATSVASTAGAVLLAGVMSLACTASAAEGVVDLRPVIEPVRAAAGIPGVSAAVMRDGEVVACGTAGVRALGDPTPVATDDRFLIGSCAKGMLRLLVARLVDAGVLRFDMTLGEALPDVPMRAEYKPVTLEQVLAFRGGISPYTQIGPKLTPWLFELTGTPPEQRAAFAAHVLSEEPAAPPGTKEVYSNAGYGIVAHIAELRADKPWETLVVEQIFQPLGMKTACVGLPMSDGSPGTRGHFHTEQGYELTPGLRKPLAPIAPAGMVSCSVSDFARYAGKLAMIQAGLPGDYLKPQTVARLVAIGPVDPKDEGILFFGGEGTFTAAYALWPSHKTAIVAQTNGGDADEVCRALIDAVRTAAAPEIPAPAPPPSGPLGLRFMMHSDDDWEITDVKAGSPAAQAGLAKGDRLVAINGVAVEKMRLPERRAALAAERIAFTVRRGDKNVECAVVVPPHGPGH